MMIGNSILVSVTTTVRIISPINHPISHSIHHPIHHQRPFDTFLHHQPTKQPPQPTPQDCDDSNPLIRALAVRTMGCIRVDKITEYMCEPLRKCLRDEDPYVRKTAAVSVAKLFDINNQLLEDQGFLDSLKDLLSDSNPMVSR